MKNLKHFDSYVNEEFTPWLKALGGATKKFIGNVSKTFQDITKSFSEDFKKIKNEQELKDKTIKVLNELASDTKKKIRSIKEMKEIKPILDEFESSIKKIMDDFKKVNESTVNESLLLGAKALFNVVGNVWQKLKKDYESELEKVKKESDRKKSLEEAKKLTINFIDKNLKESIAKIKETKISDSKGKGAQKAQPQSQSQLSAQSTSDDKVKSKYKELVDEWKQKQKDAGKKNFSPGEGTRKRLMRQASELVEESNVVKSFESFVYRYY